MYIYICISEIVSTSRNASTITHVLIPKSDNNNNNNNNSICVEYITVYYRTPRVMIYTVCIMDIIATS